MSNPFGDYGLCVFVYLSAATVTLAITWMGGDSAFTFHMCIPYNLDFGVQFSTNMFCCKDTSRSIHNPTEY